MNDNVAEDLLMLTNNMFYSAIAVTNSKKRHNTFPTQSITHTIPNLKNTRVKRTFGVPPFNTILEEEMAIKVKCSFLCVNKT